MMNIVTKKFIRKGIKDALPLSIDIYVCECGGEMREIGSAGCPHDDAYTHFFQCRSCKDVHTGNPIRTSKEELVSHGYSELE
jgi:hypothetical protein